MTFQDIMSIINFILIFFQPILWMYFFHYKSAKLDKLTSILMPVAMAVAPFIYYILLNLKISIDYDPTGRMLDPIKLFVVYLELGFAFTLYLMLKKRWNFPQAASISVLLVFIGSYYWESPYLISNAFILGFEMDWFLHLLGLMFVWFIKDTVGWKTDKWTLIMVGLGFVSATIFMLGWYIPPDTQAFGDVWNSPYYLADRIICTTIAFLAIKKEPVVWRKKKNDNNQNTS